MTQKKLIISIASLALLVVADGHAQVFYACRFNTDDGATTFWSTPELELIQVKLKNKHKIDFNETLLPAICLAQPVAQLVEKERVVPFLVALCKKKDPAFELTTWIGTTTATVFYCEDNDKQPIMMPTPLAAPAQQKCQWLYGTTTISEPYELTTKAADRYAENIAQKIARDSTSAKELYYAKVAPEPVHADQSAEITHREDPIIRYLSTIIAAAEAQKGRSAARDQKIAVWQELHTLRQEELEAASRQEKPATQKSEIQAIGTMETTTEDVDPSYDSYDPFNAPLLKIYDDMIWGREIQDQMRKTALDQADIQIFS